MDANLNIRGRLDLTEVKKGFEQLKTMFGDQGLKLGGVDTRGLRAGIASVQSVMQQQVQTVKQVSDALGSSIISSGRMSAASKELEAQLRKEQAVLNEAKQAIRSRGDAYSRLSEVTNAATRHAQNLGVQYGVNSQQFIVAAGRAEKLTKKLTEIDAATGRHFRNVGNYASGYNALAVNMSRIMGEMPNFAMDARLGFMALSNNIQPLAESIQQLTNRNKILAAQGKETISVMGQLGRAFFSWNTILMVGITALTVYGPKLVEMIKGTNGAAEAKRRAAEREKEYNQIVESSNKTAGQQIGQLATLNAVLQSNSASAAQKKKAYNELIALYPSYASQLQDEYNKTGNVANLIRNKLVPAIIAAAQARALQDKISSNFAKDLDLEVKGAQNLLRTNKALAEIRSNEAKSSYSVDGVDSDTRKTVNLISAEKELRKSRDEGNAILKERISLGSENAKVLNKLVSVQGNLDKLNTQGADAGAYSKAAGAAKSATQSTNEYASAINNLQEQLQGIDNLLQAGRITEQDALRQRIDLLNSSTDDLIKKFGTQFTGSEFFKGLTSDAEGAVIKLGQLNIQTGLLQSLYGKGTNLIKAPTIEKVEGGAGWAEKLLDSYIGSVEEWNKEIEERRKSITEMSESFSTGIIDVLKEGMVGIAEGLGTAMVTGDISNIFSGFLQSFGDALQKFGKELVAKVTIFEALRKKIQTALLSLFSGVGAPIMIGAGLGLIALGASIKALVNNKRGRNTRAFAEGGVVYGPTNALIGEYSNASTNPEVVAPLDKLKDLIQPYGMPEKIELYGRLDGRDILISNKRTKAFIDR